MGATVEMSPNISRSFSKTLSPETGNGHERKYWIRVWEEQPPIQRAQSGLGPAITLLLNRGLQLGCEYVPWKATGWTC